jgi:hypothetical protein
MIKTGLTARFAEIGKIKIGGKGEHRKSKDGSDYQLPIKYDHFVVTTTEKGKDGNFLQDNEIMAKLGKEPKEIPIRLPFDSIDMNFFTSFQYYHGKKCVCRGDGETAIRIDKNDKENTVKCNPNECPFLQEEKCKVSGILSCHIPLTMQVGAVHRFRTHSWNSVSNIIASLEYIKENTNGILQGLPLKLIFLKKATQEHGNINVVTIVLDGIEMIKMRELAYTEFQNRTKFGIDMKQLENKARLEGFLLDHDDPEDIEAEWYPPVISDSDSIEPGTSADDVNKKLTDKQEKQDKPETPKTENNNSGGLL